MDPKITETIGSDLSDICSSYIKDVSGKYSHETVKTLIVNIIEDVKDLLNKSLNINMIVNYGQSLNVSSNDGQSQSIFPDDGQSQNPSLINSQSQSSKFTQKIHANAHNSKGEISNKNRRTII